MKQDVLSQFLANKQLLSVGAIGLLAVLCLGHFGASVYRDITLLKAPGQHAAPTTQSAPKARALSVDELTSAHLFGHSNSQASSVADQAQAPETRLKLELRGVFGNTVVENGRALIAEKGKSAKYYRVQDKLPGGAELDSVATDHVMLKRNGRLETLSFSQVRPNNSSNHNVANTGPATGSNNQSSRNEQRTASIKERLKQLREARDL